jgi:citrate lyase synthetase
MQNKLRSFKKEINIEFYKQKILLLLRQDKERIAKDLIKQIAQKAYIEKKDFRGLYLFFSPIYDELFHDIIFEKIKITNNTKVLLERLALPLERFDDKERNKIIGKII